VPNSEFNRRAYFESLDRDGYVVLSSILDKTLLNAARDKIGDLLETAKDDPTWKSGGTLHLELPNDDSTFGPVVSHPLIASAVQYLLGADYENPRISYRAPLPGFGAQALHRDHIAPAKSDDCRVATVIVALVDFPADNGATRVVPGSQSIPDIGAPKQSGVPFKGEHVVTCAAGSAIVLNGHVFHSGTQNRSQSRRDALQIIYVRKGERHYSS
jgi:hypothetical protein